jgi:hypothetical protein
VGIIGSPLEKGKLEAFRFPNKEELIPILVPFEPILW